MPFSVNGIGTVVCGYRGLMKWVKTTSSGSKTKEKEFDALVCFAVFFMPIVPLKAVHTFDWGGRGYRSVQIKWSWGLVARVYARYWLTLFIACASIVWTQPLQKPLGMTGRDGATLLGLVGGAAAGLVTLWTVALSDRRNRKIRRVLGQHHLGSSDPATWTPELLASIRPAAETFGTETYADAVPPRIAAADFKGAMWAARLCLSKENAGWGESLTNDVLKAWSKAGRGPQAQSASAG